MGESATDRINDSIGQARDELRRADAKATALVSMVGAVFAGTIAVARSGLPVAAEVLLWAASAPITASAVVLLATILPFLGSGEPGSFLHAARSTPQDLVELAADGESEPQRLAVTWVTVSQIARRKYRRIRASVQLLLVGISVLAVALAVAGLAGGA